jgi:hypothetical protein
VTAVRFGLSDVPRSAYTDDLVQRRAFRTHRVGLRRAAASRRACSGG